MRHDEDSQRETETNGFGEGQKTPNLGLEVAGSCRIEATGDRRRTNRGAHALPPWIPLQRTW